MGLGVDMTKERSALEVYRKICQVKACLELRDERGELFTSSQSEALIGKINECFAIIERRRR